MIKNTLFLLLVPIFLSSCASGTGRSNLEAQDWDFIQEVGGIRLGDKYSRNGMSYVELFVDVSGNQTITTTPTKTNTGLVCERIVSVATSGVLMGELFLTVYTKPQSTLPRVIQSSQCADISLTYLEFLIFGKIYVYYVERSRISPIFNSREHLIGIIE